MQTVLLDTAKNGTSDTQKEYSPFLGSSTNKLEEESDSSATKNREDLLEELSPQAFNTVDRDGEKAKEKYELDLVFDAYESHPQANSTSPEQSVSLFFFSFLFSAQCMLI